MADYKELLRRAISALPENNGVARRAVYEKARSALVGQLRAISPPLPARDITQHRLQLEDCIRQVEQEASEAIISLGRDSSLGPRFSSEPKPQPVTVAPVAQPMVAQAAIEVPEEPVAQPTAPPAMVSIEDIISQAAATSGTVVETVSDPVLPALLFTSKPVLRPVPNVATAGPTSPLSSAPRSNELPLKLPNFEPRQDPMPLAASAVIEPSRSGGRSQALVRQPDVVPVILPATQPVETALSSVREVELEKPHDSPRDAEGVIERAIETLDREARGEPTEPLPETAREAADRMFSAPKTASWTPPETPSFTPANETAARSGGGLTIFLIVFAVLLAGAGGAGFWAWREGYIDLDQMFGQSQPVTDTEAVAVSPATTPTLDPVQTPEASVAVSDGPGNTATTTDAPATSTLDGLQTDDRLEATPETVVPTGTEATLPDIGATEEPKGEERLTGDDATVANVNDPAASVDPAVLAGSQSLLLEASADGRTGAVPFSGTIEWTEGTDELGLPTIIGNASIPARNLSVQITIRKNSDPSLPASHLLEVDFNVTDTFIGGTIANLPGVLLKDEELVPGTPLVGASARVVGNSFLFALSASASDVTTNTNLLENRRWMDLAVVYGTGRNAIITLEKDDAAQAMFDTVFTAWAQ